MTGAVAVLLRASRIPNAVLPPISRRAEAILVNPFVDNTKDFADERKDPVPVKPPATPALLAAAVAVLEAVIAAQTLVFLAD